MINRITLLHQAPHLWGFLFVGGWVDLGMNRILKNILVFIAECILGSCMNMGLIITRNQLIHFADGVNPMDAKSPGHPGFFVTGRMGIYFLVSGISQS